MQGGRCSPGTYRPFVIVRLRRPATGSEARAHGTQRRRAGDCLGSLALRATCGWLSTLRSGCPPYPRCAPPAWATHSGVEVVRGAWSWGQVTPGYSRRTTLWFEGGRCDRPQGSHKNDTSGVEPVERPSHGPPRGTRGVPLGWSSPPPRVVSRGLQGGESEPPGW